MKRSIITLVLIFGLTGIVTAGPMTLTNDGHLYKVWAANEGLVLSHSAPGEDLEESLVPLTVGVSLDTVNILVNEEFATPFIVWSDDLDGTSKVRLAALIDGTWFGPVTLAGDDGVAARNPQIQLHTAVSTIEDETGDPMTLETTFLHTVWWSNDQTGGLGYAVYAPIPLNEEGFPLVEKMTTTDLHDLMPYGLGCDATAYSDGLAQPQFFTGEGGMPLLFTTDFGDCVFQILAIDYAVEEDIDPNTGLKRRRQITVWRSSSDSVAIPPGVALTDSKMALGHNYTVLIYWDNDGGIDWLLSGTEGWTDVKTLPTGPDLSHEQAVELLLKLLP